MSLTVVYSFLNKIADDIQSSFLSFDHFLMNELVMALARPFHKVVVWPCLNAWEDAL